MPRFIGAFFGFENVPGRMPPANPGIAGRKAGATISSAVGRAFYWDRLRALDAARADVASASAAAPESESLRSQSADPARGAEARRSPHPLPPSPARVLEVERADGTP